MARRRGAHEQMERSMTAERQDEATVRPSIAGDGFTTRPVVMGRRGAITSGHYLASAGGMRMYERGGNAVDAAVAAGFALAVVKPQDNGIGGEVPMLIHQPTTGRLVAISGQGTAPAGATIDWFRAAGISLIPGNGLLPAMVPAAFDAWITALAAFGTLSLHQVLQPALELAHDGFAMYPALRRSILLHEQKFREQWPTTAAIYLPDGRVPEVGDCFRQRDWAASMGRTVDAEARALRAGAERRDALQAARDEFYRGSIALTIGLWAEEREFLDHSGTAHRGLLRYDDLAGYATRIEEPVSIEYHGYRVHKCGPWSQGPVFLQQLRLLEGFNLRALGHNSAAYVHTVVESAKLAFADRDRYYGDPLFVDVPLAQLLSREYAASRRRLIDPDHASLRIFPGEPVGGTERPPRDVLEDRHDTTHLDAIDRDGLMISATPSGGWMPSSPVIEGLGFPLGTRGQMFWLDPAHPSSLQPGKRPRTTLTPSLVTRDGAPHMVFGTPGGDQQDQWTLQFFLNMVHFGMDLQAALDAPLFHTDHFPSSFYPREIQLGSLSMERRLADAVGEVLERAGHRITVAADWALGGQVCGARFDPVSGRIEAAASPRNQVAYAMGY
jgi:gamma-glutamyltranspeptidase/glutathione hydrolase